MRTRLLLGLCTAALMAAWPSAALGDVIDLGGGDSFDNTTGELVISTRPGGSGAGFSISADQTEYAPGVPYSQIKSVRFVVQPHSGNDYTAVRLGTANEVVSRGITTRVDFTRPEDAVGVSIEVTTNTDAPATIIAAPRSLDLNGDGSADMSFNAQLRGGFILRTGSGHDTVDLGSLDITSPVHGGAFASLRTFGGNDRITSTRIRTIISPGRGNDHVTGVAKPHVNAFDDLFEQAGNDTVVVQEGGRMNARLGTGNDVLRSRGVTTASGGPGNDRYYGGPAKDQFIGGTGVDKFWGGGAKDVFQDASGISHAWMGPGNDSVYLDERHRDRHRVNCGDGKDSTFDVSRNRARSCERFWWDGKPQ